MTSKLNVLIHKTIELHFNCLDINECNLANNDCNQNADCTNTDGSYVCSCNTGYYGDGKTCDGSRIIHLRKKINTKGLNTFFLIGLTSRRNYKNKPGGSKSKSSACIL